MRASSTDVLIVGGGPVGLYLGCLLLQNGISCRILEKRSRPSTHSRSIGIHPPGLECLAEIGIAETLIAHGIPVAEGLAFANTDYLGRLTFESCPPPYRFVLALPQFLTESVLEQRLVDLDPKALIRSTTVTAIQEEAEDITVLTDRNGSESMYHSQYVVGCDGQHSIVRTTGKIRFPGGAYSDTFVMGDFKDATDLGDRAAIYLTDDGVVESFPLPGGVRRWVAKTESLIGDPAPETLASIIHDRTGRVIHPESNSMISAFGVHNYLAVYFAKNRIVLAGDAAHVVSPIGGQGMNLGWLDARLASVVLTQAVRMGEPADRLFEIYSRVRRRSATIARRRAEFNMWMGRPSRMQSLKYLAVGKVLRSPLRDYFARRFTMHRL